MARPGDRLVGLRHPWAQAFDEVRAPVDDRRADLHEAVVPELQCGQLALGDACATRRLEQAVALPEHAVVVRQDAGEPRRELNEQLVEEPAAARRLSAHEREILGSEEHGRDVARELPRLHGDPVHLGAVRAGPVQLHLEQHVTVRVLQSCAHDRRVDPAPDEGLVARDPVRSEGAQVRDRLDEVGLALPVGSDEHVRPGHERDLERLVVPEVDEAQLRDDHDRSLMGVVLRPCARRDRRTACAAPRRLSSPASPSDATRTARRSTR